MTAPLSPPPEPPALVATISPSALGLTSGAMANPASPTDEDGSDLGWQRRHPTDAEIAARAKPWAPHHFSLLAGFGVGVGSSAFAGNWFALADVWLSKTIGVGAEYERAGSTTIVILGPNDSDHFKAARARLTLRFPLGEKSFFVAAGAVGWGSGRQRREWYCYNEGAGCDDPDEVATSTQDFSGLSGAVELEYRAQYEEAELAFVARVAVAGPACVVTIGPSVGFGF